MKSNQKGFSAVTMLLLFVIVAVVGFVGWYVWQHKNSTKPTTPSQIQQPAVYKRTTTVPSSWKTYTSNQYKFSFSYPADSNVNSHVSKSWKNSKFNLQDNAFDYKYLLTELSLKKNSEPLQGASYGFIDILDQNADTSVSQLRQHIEAYNEESKQMSFGISLTLNTQTMLISNHKLVIAETKTVTTDSPTEGKTTTSTEKSYYIEYKDKTYLINVTTLADNLTAEQAKASNGATEQEALTIFESIQFQD